MIEPTASSGISGQSGEIQLKTAQTLGNHSRAVAVRVFVVDTGAGGSVVLRLGGSTIHATSSLPLRRGESYFAKIHRAAGRVTLRIEAQVSRALVISEVGRSAGLPADAIADAVVRAFVRTELPLVPDRLLKAYRRVSGSAKEGVGKVAERARLEAIAEKKGLTVSGEFLDAIAGLSGNPSDGGERGGSGKRDSSSGRERSRGTPAINPAEIRNSFSLTEEATHPLHLFNHVVGDGDHWVIVPIQAPGTGLRASLRILIPRQFAMAIKPDTAPFREAVLVAENDDERWVFGIAPSGSQLRAAILSGPPAEPGVLQVLADQLREAGILMDPDTRAAGHEDGFSHRKAEDIMTSVDSSV